MIKIQGLTRTYGSQDVFKGCDLHIGPSDRVGLIGRNGCGKTTLLRLILGEEELSSGEIVRPKDLTIGYLPQNLIHFKGKRVLPLVMAIAEDLEHVERQLEETADSLRKAEPHEEVLRLAERQGRLHDAFRQKGGYELEVQAKRVLLGLGFREGDFQRPIEELSGGWMMRAAMARILLSRPDLVLLDEPTNHLDLESMVWMEDYLTQNVSALVVVSHDRVFLNHVVNRIVEIDGGQLTSYAGNYDFYVAEKEKRLKILQGAYDNQQERIRQIERFIERNRVRKDRARQVQSRIKMLEKMERIALPVQEQTLDFTFPPAPRAPRTLIELRGVSKCYNTHVIYDHIDLCVSRGDRIAFVGPNGTGKTTLLKILTGEVDFEGERIFGSAVHLGVFSQEQMDRLSPHLTVLEEVESVAGNQPQGQLRSLLGSFLFRGDDVFKKVSVLSGGERSRLLLCKILVQPTNLLLFDEPTNHLDIPSREMLELALRRYGGSMCIITHDRHLINALATKVLVVHHQKVEIHPGNFDDYQTIWCRRESLAPEDGTSRRRKGTSSKRIRSQRRTEAEWRNRFFQEAEPLRQRLAILERSIEEKTEEMDQISSVLAREDTSRDLQRLRKLSETYGAMKAQAIQWTQEWESTAAELEGVERRFEETRPRAEDV